MRRTFVQIDGVLYEKGTEPYERVAPDVMPDIKPYKSMVDGSVIGSRSTHREHLKTHGYEEVGKDPSLFRPQAIPDVSPQKRKELIRSQIASLTNRQFEDMHKRAIDNWKWNSRE